MQQIKNIIFDLGGVIINLDIPATANAFQQLAKKYGNNDYSPNVEHPVFSEFEVGAITEQDFRNTLKTYINPMVSDNEIDTAWNAMLLDFPVERLNWLSQIKNKYNIYLFSNTNAIHYNAFIHIYEQVAPQIGLDTQFEHFFTTAYYSHTLGQRKPEVAAFEAVIRDAKLDPAQTLFIDDTLLNIEGAQKAGLQTIFLSGGVTVLDLGL